MIKSFEIKKDVDINDMQFLHPNLFILLSAICLYAFENNLHVVISSLREDVLGRKYRTHTDGRAFDVSVKGWPLKNIKEVEYNFNDKFKDIAAISARDGKPRAVVYHKVTNSAYHFHFQVKSDCKIKLT